MYPPIPYFVLIIPEAITRGLPTGDDIYSAGMFALVAFLQQIGYTES